MIQIPYQRAVGPARAPGIVRLAVEGGGEAIAQGVAVAGEHLRRYGQGLVEQEKRADRARVALAYTQSEGYWQTNLEERARNLTGDGEGFTDGVKQDHEAYSATFLEEHGSRDPEVRAWLQERLADQRGRLMIRAMDIQGTRRGLYQGQAVEQTTALWADTAFRAPGDFATHLAGFEAAVDLLGLDPGIDAKLRAEGRAVVAKAAGLSLAETDPTLALQGVREGAAWAALLSPEARHGIGRTAQAELNRREAETKAAAREAEQRARLDRLEAAHTLERDHADNLALLQAGQPPRRPLTRDDVAAAFAAGERAEAWATIQAETRHAEAVGSLADKSPDEIAAILEAERPDPQSPGFAAAQERFTNLQKAVAANARSLAADPAGHVLRVVPRIGELLATGEPEDYAQAVTASLAEQARLGVPPSERRPLPDAAVQNLARTIGEAAGPEERLALLTQFTAPLGDGLARDRLLRDLEDEGLVEGTRFAAAAAERGDRAAAVRILTALENDVKPTTDQKRELREALDEPDAHGEAAAMVAGWTGDATPLRDLADEREVIEKVAAVMVAAGADPDDAVRRARAVVQGAATRPLTLDWLGAVTLPADADPDRVERGLRVIRSSLPELFGLGERQEAIGDGDTDAKLSSATLADVVEDWIEGARWIDHPNGGFALIVETVDGGRRYLPGADGQPLVVDLDQVMEAATPQAKAAKEQSKALWGEGWNPSMRRIFGGIGSDAIIQIGPIDWLALRDAVPGLGATIEGGRRVGEGLDALGGLIVKSAEGGTPLVLPASPGAGGPGAGGPEAAP